MFRWIGVMHMAKKKTLICPECKTKNKVLSDVQIITCSKCGHSIFDKTKREKKMKFLRKITGANARNDQRMREENLVALQQGVNNLYDTVLADLQKGDFKDALDKTYELFYLDNSYNKKHYYLFLAQIKAKDSKEAYDAFRKLKKSRRTDIIHSSNFQKLHSLSDTRSLLDDILRHTYFKKVQKQNRVDVPLSRDF